MKIEHKDAEYPCSDCGKCFTKAKKLRMHIERAHIKPIKCDKCFKSFGTKRGLKHHIVIIHSNKVKPVWTEADEIFKCDICNDTFRTMLLLKGHVQRVHDESNMAKPFQCSICYKHFSSEERLDHHFARVHELRNCEKCPYCEKQYSKLKTHIQTCNVKWQKLQGHRPTFECPKQCGKTFQTKEGVRRHIKKHCQKRNSV